MFENLVVSNKCKTVEGGIKVVLMFENLVVSNKCKTVNPCPTLSRIV